MNWDTISFDWNQVRAFLATVEEGSLSGAARALGQTQPTLSRQITALEERLGVVLLERGHRAIELTQSGLELIDHVRVMADAANRISLAATGQSQAIEGRVGVTASDAISAYIMPDAIAELKEIAPGIEVELIVSNEVRDLNTREADIAIRHVRPERSDFIGKLVREDTAHLYASAEYLDTFGRPQCREELSKHDFIGFVPSEKLAETLNTLGLGLTIENFKVHVSSGFVMFELIKKGLGIGVMPKDYADMVPDLEQVLPELEPLPLSIWLVTHKELYTSRRIRLVYDFLVERFEKADFA